MAWLTMPALIGPVLGPPVGGFIVTYFSWRWIFYINVPIGLLGHRAGARCSSRTMREPSREPFDVLGLVLSGTALACLMFGIEIVTRGVGASIGLGVIARGRGGRRALCLARTALRPARCWTFASCASPRSACR